MAGRRVPAADQAQAVRVHGRRDHGVRGREDRYAAEVHADSRRAAAPPSSTRASPSVDFGKPAASTFDFKPSKGTKVTEADELTTQDREKAVPQGADQLDGLNVIGEGWTSIAELKLPKEAGGMASGAASGELPADAQSS